MTNSLNLKGSEASVYKRRKRKHARGVIRHLGTEWILMRVETFHEMRREIDKALGTGASVVCYLAGKGAGRSLANLMQQRAKTNTLEEIYKRIAEIYEKCGWGILQPVLFRQRTGEFLLRIYNNAFARGLQSRSSACYYVKGLLEGIIEELAGRHAKSEETKCMAKGDAYCEFILVLK